MESSEPKKISCTCPNGHKVRGDVSFAGEKVRCPRCQQTFVFGEKQTEKAPVTESAVMRILVDPQMSEDPVASMFDNPRQEAPKTCPCSRCGVAIDETATVCKHCNSYVGAMPGFMQTLMKGNPFTRA